MNRVKLLIIRKKIAYCARVGYTAVDLSALYSESSIVSEVEFLNA